MANQIINGDYTIDLDSENTEAHCPYCGGEAFVGVTTVTIIEPDPITGNGDVYENTCVGCGEKSVWKDHGQFKIVT